MLEEIKIGKVARSSKEIKEFLKSPDYKELDPLGMCSGDLILAMDYEDAAEYLNEEHVEQIKSGEEKWEQTVDPFSEMRDYMDFAIEKATGHRGLSAGRSISHMQLFSWLSGDEELINIANSEHRYGPYGVPILKAISDHIGMDENIIKMMDSPEFKRMASGESCRPDCNEGC